MNSRTKVLLADAARVALLAALSSASNVPRIWAPFSLLSTIPNLYGGSLGAAVFAGDDRYVSGTVVELCGAAFAACCFALLYVLWCFRPVENERIPLRSNILLSVAVIADGFWLARSAPYGFEHQGMPHTSLIILFNIVGLGVATVCLLRNRRSPSPDLNRAFHVALFGTLAFCAFPWLGELI